MFDFTSDSKRLIYYWPEENARQTGIPYLHFQKTYNSPASFARNILDQDTCLPLRHTANGDTLRGFTLLAASIWPSATASASSLGFTILEASW